MVDGVRDFEYMKRKMVKKDAIFRSQENIIDFLKECSAG